MFAIRIVRRVALGLLFGCALSVPAWAQGVGAIGGTVTDESGAVLPGVAVTLSSPGVIGGDQSTVSDTRGAYQFTRLVPGKYSVKGELQGFRSMIQENITVSSDNTARADLKLSVGDLAETITVAGAAPLLDTTSALNQTVMSREVLDTLPTPNDIWAIARLSPGITLTKYDVGGREMLGQSTAFVHGSKDDEKSYLVDGMDLNSYTSGTSINFYPDSFSFQEINYEGGQSPAERAVGGVVMNMVSKTGTNVVRGSGMFSGTNSALAGNNVSPELRAQLLAGVPAAALAANPNLEPGGDIDRLFDSAVVWSGPVIKDRLWFVMGGKFGQSNNYKVGSYNSDGTQLLSDNTLINTQGKLSLAATSNAQLHFMHLWVQKGRYHVAGGPTVTEFFDTQASLYNNSRNHFWLGRWTQVLSSRMVFDAALSVMNGQNNQVPQKEVPAGAIGVFDSVSRVNTVAAANYSVQEGARMNLATSLSYVAGVHDIKFGYQMINNDGNGGGNSPSGMRAVYRNGVPDSVNTYNHPTKYQIVSKQHALYIQDKWRPVPKLTLNLGVRFETAYGTINDVGNPDQLCQVETIFIAGRCFAAIKGVPDFKDAVPRLSAIFDVFGDGTTALKFSANRYRMITDRGYSEVITPIRVVSDTRAWTVCAAGQTSACDLNGDKTPQFNELGPSTGFNLGTTTRYADDITRPYSNEIAAEIEQQLPGMVVISAGYFYRGHRNQLAQTNLAVPTSGYTALLVTEATSGKQVTVYNQDPATRGLFDVVIDNSPVRNASFKGVDLTIQKRMSNHWMLLGSMSYGKTDDDIYGATADLNNPNFTFRRGPLTQDVPLFVKMAGAYEMPYGVTLGSSVQSFKGWPDTTTVRVGADTVRLTQVNQTLVVEPRGTTNLPTVTMVDLNVRKIFASGRFRLEPRLDFFNLLNASAVTQRITQLGPSYGRAIEILGARIIKLGVNVNW